MAVWVEFVGIRHIPRPGCDAVVVADRLLHSAKLLFLSVESISVEILFAANFSSALHCIDLENGVIRPINIGINSETEEMLMIVGVNPGVDFCSPALGILAWVHSVCVQDACKLDLQLHGTVLVEDPIHAVFVVCRCENVRNDELATSGNND